MRRSRRGNYVVIMMVNSPKDSCISESSHIGEARYFLVTRNLGDLDRIPYGSKRALKALTLRNLRY